VQDKYKKKIDSGSYH